MHARLALLPAMARNVLSPSVTVTVGSTDGCQGKEKVCGIHPGKRLYLFLIKNLSNFPENKISAASVKKAEIGAAVRANLTLFHRRKCA